MREAWLKVRSVVTSRWFVKGAFFTYFVYACVQLMRFAAWARGEGPYVDRPEGPAGILPVGHYTSFFAWVRGGGWDTLLPAGLVIILGALALSFFFKRGFCGWICPVGTLWQGFAAVGRKLLGRNIRMPKWLDLILRGLRYAIAAMVLSFLLRVSIAEAVGFRELPYMWTADIKIISGFGEPLFLAVALFAGAISMLFGPVWCRYLCPLGGWYGALGTLSPLWVHRDAETCIDCKKCTKSCHAFIDVHAKSDVHSPECDGCMDCVKVCPVNGCLEATVAGKKRVPAWVWPVLVVGVWMAIYGTAKLTGNWDSSIPNETFKSAINSGIIESVTPMF